MEATALIDLRSDTVTRPTAKMREAMACAEVGDDVFGEDPTVHRLEERVAELVGKEAALFVPSGTMANQVALRSQTEPGDEVIASEGAHCVWYETGALAVLSGVQAMVVGRDGLFDGDDVARAVRPTFDWYPRTSLVAVENTHNRGGGRVWPLAQLREVVQVARRHGLKTHMDGARLWHAAAALGLEPATIAADFDSVSVCFSKGLGAPVGSAVCGSRELIARARRVRKMLGGGMRQAGVIAAAALHALEHHRGRLGEDHANAKLLATRLAQAAGAVVDLERVETNIVMIDTPGVSAARVEQVARQRGVLVAPFGPERVRAVTHLDVAGRVEEAADALAAAIEEAGRAA